jgi:hypothetical protein
VPQSRRSASCADVRDSGVDHAESNTSDPVIASERSQKRLPRYGWAPADRPRRPVLFVNPTSGGGKVVRAGVAERARERGIEVIVLSPGQNLAALVGEVVARGADALGVAGGDGSLAVVVAAAHPHGLPFVCIPAGTRNHFALDLGVDRHDLVGALDAFADGVERRIDVAQVNGCFDPTTRRQLGNFPQAFSHLALLEAAAPIIVAEAIPEYIS